MPEEYWLVCLSDGLVYPVDPAVALEAHGWMKNRDFADHLDIETLYGAEVTIYREHVLAIESTTPETRRKNREHNEELKRERQQQGFLDED